MVQRNRKSLYGQGNSQSSIEKKKKKERKERVDESKANKVRSDLQKNGKNVREIESMSTI